MKTCVACVLWLGLALGGAAGADTIRMWQTPTGTLHLGEDPPEGSVLLEAVQFEDAAFDPAAMTAADVKLAEAAAEGREIIRRRAAEREAERTRRSEAAIATAGVDPEAPATHLIVITTPRRFRNHFDHDRIDGPPFDGPIFRDPPEPAPPPAVPPAPPSRARGGKLEKRMLSSL